VSSTEIKLSEHPRAVRHIAMAKGWGGLAGFGLVVLLSLQAGTATPDLMLRALIGGVLGYVLAWGTTVIVWRQLAVAEVRAHTMKLIDARQRRQTQIKAAADARQARGADGPAPDQTMVLR
jgi:uncharacterized membrane protein YccC